MSAGPARRHLLATPAGADLSPIEAWRHRWDPVMASNVPAHVTVSYPEETVDEDELLRRMAGYAGTATPFRLRLGEVFADEDGKGGVFVVVDDAEGGWAAMRRRLGLAPMGWPPHVTVVHPRTSSQGTACFAELRGRRLDLDADVREVLFTETTPDSFTVLRRFPLAGTP